MPLPQPARFSMGHLLPAIAQADLTGVVFLQIIREDAAREIPRKAHLRNASNRDPVGGGRDQKLPMSLAIMR